MADPCWKKPPDRHVSCTQLKAVIKDRCRRGQHICLQRKDGIAIIHVSATLAHHSLKTYHIPRLCHMELECLEKLQRTATQYRLQVSPADCRGPVRIQVRPLPVTPEIEGTSRMPLTGYSRIYAMESCQGWNLTDYPTSSCS